MTSPLPPTLPDDARCSASNPEPQRRLDEFYDLAFGGGVIPTWTTRLHSNSSSSNHRWLAAPITVEVREYAHFWSIDAEVQLRAPLRSSCSHLAVAATSVRSIYSGVATRADLRGRHASDSAGGDNRGKGSRGVWGMGAGWLASCATR